MAKTAQQDPGVSQILKNQVPGTLSLLICVGFVLWSIY